MARAMNHGGGQPGDALKKAGFSNPDLYQIATYTQIVGSKNEGRPVVGVLVYPTDGVDVEQTISQVQLRGDDAQKLPLWVAGWDVTSTPAAGGRELWRRIKALRNRTEKGPIKADPRAD